MRRLIVAVGIVTSVVSGHRIEAATRCVAPGGAGGCDASIQSAITAASSGDVVLIRPGTYQENIIVSKPLTLAGTDRDEVVIHPATSNPDCASGGGGSLCGGAAANIILVQADHVTIRNLTLDGDNPWLTSTIVRGGADVDARNGIITNHLVGVFEDLTVDHVSVVNIYLRGIYASSGGTFNFHHNRVSNVQGDEASIGIFNFGGAGIMADNRVAETNDAISSNHSRGVRFLRNRVAKSASGIHTDNTGDGGGGLDVIEGNRVSAGTPGSYGIWVFVPYLPVTVHDNDISDVDVGLAAFGQGAAVTSTFADNRVSGASHAGSAGAFVTTDQLGWGAANVSAAFERNVISGFADGMFFASDLDTALSVTASCGTIRKTTVSGVRTAGNGTSVVTLRANNLVSRGVGVDNQIGALVNPASSVNAASNWWGCPAGPGGHGCAQVIGPVSVSPWLARPSRCAVGDDGDDRGGAGGEERGRAGDRK